VASYALNEEVARCTTAGTGFSGQEFGRLGDEDAPEAMTEIDSMTICSGFVRREMGGTVAGGGGDGGQASRRPVMLRTLFDAGWQRPRECVACSCFLHVFWHFCGLRNRLNYKSLRYLELPTKYVSKHGGLIWGVKRGVAMLAACRRA